MRILVALCLVGTISHAGEIVGTIVDILGTPVSEATVALESSLGRWNGTTDTEGRFVFRNLDAGQYTLKIHRSGFVDTSVTEITVSDPIMLNRIPLAVALCGTDVIRTWSAAPNGRASLRGLLTVQEYGSNDYTAVPSAQIDVLDDGGRTVRTVRTDQEGRFVVDGLGAAAYSFRYKDHSVIHVLPSNLTAEFEWQVWESCPDGGCDAAHPPRYAICE